MCNKIIICSKKKSKLLSQAMLKDAKIVPNRTKAKQTANHGTNVVYDCKDLNDIVKLYYHKDRNGVTVFEQTDFFRGTK